MKLFFLILIILFSTIVSFSTNIYSPSVSFFDVSNSINSASAGDTVYLPYGIGDWGDSSLTIPGGISLIGQGKDLTEIKRSQSTSVALILFDGSNGLVSELHNIYFSGIYNNDSVYTTGVGFINGCVNFKVSGCKFTGFANAALYVGYTDYQKGVIYCNEFSDNFYPAISNLGYGVAVYGAVNYPPLDLGTDNAVFVEDNYFYGNRHHIASNGGSKYVFRYNDVIHNQYTKNYSMVDAHGLSAVATGSRSYEVYHNDFSVDFTTGWARTAVGIRGGDGVVFNNTCGARIFRMVELWVEGFSCGTYPGPYQILSMYSWGNGNNDQHGYTTNGVVSNCDSSVRLNRDYFDSIVMPGYTPYTYPHPLRSGSFCSNTTSVFNSLNESTIKLIYKEVEEVLLINSKELISNVEIYNIRGGLVYKNQFNYNQLNINSGFLNKGIYIVRVYDVNGGLASKKFIKI